MTEIVYNLWNTGLGDHIASISLLAQMSIERCAPVSFATPNVHRTLELLDLLDLGEAELDDRSSGGNTDLDGFNVWATEYLPAKARWRRSRRTRFICTHFEGLSAAADKNPPQGDIDQIGAWASQEGLGVVSLSHRITLARAAELLASCTLFVGCDSGMSHLAHTVACPTYLLEYQLPVVTCHRHKPYVLCKGAGHFTQQAANHLAYLRAIRG